MSRIDFEFLKKQGKKEIDKAKDLKELDGVFRKYLGKKGEVTQVLGSLKDLPKEKRAYVGKEGNLIKDFLGKKIGEKKRDLQRKERKEKEKREAIDITIPGKRLKTGYLHLITSAQKEIVEIFGSMGFSVIDGPHIENEWYNFDSLNIPKNHPARDAWDTFWLKDKKGSRRFLLRTHTSPVQVRYMEKNNPPLRIIVPGKVFRHEASDASHEAQFYHVEGLMIDKDISLANLKGILESFIQQFFGKDTKIRWRSGFFPFVEPGVELDVQCSICKGKGCSTCNGSGWLEMIGAGMVHPNVLKASKLNPKNWQGFAFGMGLDRLIMVKYKVNDIRLFYSGDLRFLKQF